MGEEASSLLPLLCSSLLPLLSGGRRMKPKSWSSWKLICEEREEARRSNTWLDKMCRFQL